MSYEFKKISEVEILETVSDEAHVLVEENGAIKRVPKTEVGGAGVEAPDMIIRISAEFSDEPATLTADRFSIESGSLEAVKNKLVDGEVPVVKVKYYYEHDEYDNGYFIEAAEYLCDVCKYSDGIFFDFINIQGHHKIVMSLGDTDYISYQFTPFATISGGIIF